MASGGSGDNELFLSAIRNKLMDVNGPLYYFYNVMMGGTYTMPTQGNIIHRQNFHPAINGYTLVFLQAPHLSGYESLGILTSSHMEEFTKMVCFIAVDFTPPPVQVTASELPSRSGSLPYAAEVSGTGQLSISYLDDANEHCFGYHKLWLSYIEDITRGITVATGQEIEPDPVYYTPDFDQKIGGKIEKVSLGGFGQIDYMTSAYVLKFKPVEGSVLGEDIIYIGKATGIFPINQPDKEVIGRRDSPELVTLTYNYPCANYRAWSYGTPNQDEDEYLKDEYLEDIASKFSGGSMLGIFSAVQSAINLVTNIFG